MKSKGIIISFVIIILIALAVFLATRAGSGSAQQQPATPDNGAASVYEAEPIANDTSADKTFTMADVEAHHDASSCYTAINGAVYDVTDWISRHPGGSKAILGLCGTDGSSAFDAQHGGQARPEQELATLKIGTLANQ